MQPKGRPERVPLAESIGSGGSVLRKDSAGGQARPTMSPVANAVRTKCPYAQKKLETKTRAAQLKYQGTFPSASAAVAVKEGQAIPAKPGQITQSELEDLAEAKKQAEIQKAQELKDHQQMLLKKFLSKFPPKRLPN